MSGDSFQSAIDFLTATWAGVFVTVVIAVIAYFRDRVRLKVTYQTGVITHNFPGIRPDELVTTLTVTNTGRRPVTIRQLRYRELRKNMWYIFRDSLPQHPCELTEGDFLVGFIKETEDYIDTVAYFSAVDASGREYRVGVAPLYMRAIWNIRRRFIKDRQLNT